MKRNILAVGAHPDDVELGCGGSISKHLSLGDEVYVLVMTNGEKGGHSPQRQECLSSLKRLGVKEENIIFGNFSDGSIEDNLNVVNFIEEIIRDLGIDRVYTHYFNDRHQDHRNCSLAASSAARKVSEIFLYQGPSTKAPFEPHYFIELREEDLNKKIASLESYETQIKKGVVSLEWIKNLAVVNGIPYGKKYAEAFAINHFFRGGQYV